MVSNERTLFFLSSYLFPLLGVHGASRRELPIGFILTLVDPQALPGSRCLRLCSHHGVFRQDSAGSELSRLSMAYDMVLA